MDKVVFNRMFKKKWVYVPVVFFLIDDSVLGEYSGYYITINMNLARFYDKPVESLHDIVIVLLHEMVHCYNDQILGKSDTTKTGYHTKVFKEQAEKRGLIFGVPDEKIGYYDIDIRAEVYNRILDNMSESAWKVLTQRTPREEYYM